MDFETQQDRMPLSDVDDVVEDDLSEEGDKDSADGISVTLTIVWDSPKINKFIGAEDGKAKWTCYHCNGTWSKWNHSKVIRHLFGGPDIQKWNSKIEDK
jgi:hypothetical protein